MFRLIIFIVIVTIIIATLYFIFTYQHDNLKISRIVPFILKSDTILDLGCGSCCATKTLQTNGYYKTIGLDVVNKGVCLQPTIYDGYTIPYPDQYFDVVISAFVLHHIPHYPKILQEIDRVTKKRFILFEDTPNCNIDYYFTKLHAGSDWGKCDKCFLRKKEWIDTIENKTNFKLKNLQNIPRYEFPFSNKPYLYPVPKTFFVFDKTNQPRQQ